MSQQKIEVLRGHLRTYAPVNFTHQKELTQTVQKLLANGKGLLAADESESTCAKRFASIGIENNAENRRRYRELMLNTDGLEQYISGVILHEETFYQKSSSGALFPELLRKKRIVAGVKTDKGLVDLISGAPGEQATQGLDNYLKRAQGYYKAGARFCKWRNVYRIQNGTVSDALVQHNAETLARYALLSQAAGLVPIVEPEVMIDGTHTLEQCQDVSTRVWSVVAQKLHEHGVCWEGMLLKPNMVVPGAESGVKASPAQVARATLTALSHAFPAAMPGVVFLSGGLSEVQASEYLNAMNLPSPCAPRPWALRFSYARALQASALKAWGGTEDGVSKGRAVLLHRAKMNSLATMGKYDRSADDAESKSLYVKGYKY